MLSGYAGRRARGLLHSYRRDMLTRAMGAIIGILLGVGFFVWLFWLVGKRQREGHMIGGNALPLHKQDLRPQEAQTPHVATELERLAALHENDGLTDAEFASAKAKLLRE
jgi:hypothetical protein